MDFNCTSFNIWAVGQHHSGNIWVAIGTEIECKMPITMIHKWLPKLSNQLSYMHQTYPVLVHGIPTTFNTSHDGWDVTVNLISYNSNIITQSSALQHVEFLTCMHSQMPHKTHGSLILHFTDPTVANNCIA